MTAVRNRSEGPLRRDLGSAASLSDGRAARPALPEAWR